MEGEKGEQVEPEQLSCASAAPPRSRPPSIAVGSCSCGYYGVVSGRDARDAGERASKWFDDHRDGQPCPEEHEWV